MDPCALRVILLGRQLAGGEGARLCGRLRISVNAEEGEGWCGVWRAVRRAVTDVSDVTNYGPESNSGGGMRRRLQ